MERQKKSKESLEKNMAEMQKLLTSKQSKVGAKNSKKVDHAIEKAGKDLPLFTVKLSSRNSKKTPQQSIRRVATCFGISY